MARRSIVVVMDPTSESGEDVLRANRSREKRFAFHHAMDGKTSNEATIRTPTPTPTLTPVN